MTQLNYIRHIILYCLFLLLCLPSISLSIIYKITDNTADDWNPSLYDGKIAWQSNVDGNWEIYYWDGTTTSRITNNTASDMTPSLYEEKIAWSGYASGNWEIYYGDKCGIRRITYTPDDDKVPSLYNETIAWESDVDGNWEIYYWNGFTTRPISTDATTHNNLPSLYNGKIAWENGGEIYLWDLTDNPAKNMTESADIDIEPSLSNGKIAWTSIVDDTSDIYFLANTDNATPVRITNSSDSEEDPPLASLYETTIAWDSIADGDFEIHYWNGTVSRQITENTSEDWYPSLYDGKIAWQSDVDGDMEIYYWDGESRVLVNAGYDQKVSACEIVTLDGTNTFDPDGVIDDWTWLLEYRGDPSKNITAIDETETATVSDLTAGIYDVTLTVTDNVGEEATDTMLLEVDHNPWDVDNDCRKGLAEVISILQELTGQ